MPNKRRNWPALTLGVLLLLSLGFLAYVAFFGGYELFFDSYLQSSEELYNMECGALYNYRTFREGEDLSIRYDQADPSYRELLDRYNLKQIAGEGGEFVMAKNLMNEFAGRLRHKSDYDNHVEMNALALLDYSLNQPGHGINCRAKAQILNEMCLALGLYARKVWIMPMSRYDGDCHVVNEVWDSTLEKWVMLDITNNAYWVDEARTPLSLLEIREHLANQEFCTPMDAGDPAATPERSRKKNFGNLLYIAKNLVYFEYLDGYGTGEEGAFYLLFPENLNTNYEYFLSEAAVRAAPGK